MATKFKVKKNLTLPLLKFNENEPRYVKILGAMFVGKEMKQKLATDKKKEPATLCNAVNLEDGEEVQIILHAVVKSIFSEEYPNDSYVGKGFEITKKGKDPGKDYNRFLVQEIELPAETTPTAAKK